MTGTITAAGFSIEAIEERLPGSVRTRARALVRGQIALGGQVRRSSAADSNPALLWSSKGAPAAPAAAWRPASATRINGRLDTVLSPIRAGTEGPQAELLGDAFERANAYLDADANCVFPTAIWEPELTRSFAAQTHDAFAAQVESVMKLRQAQAST
jgi:hypothetical protein